MRKTHAFTSGTWFIAPNGRVKRAIYAEGQSYPIAEVRASPSIPAVVSDANAQLLVSAPDMLDALETGTEAAQCVLNNWTQGNLAAAVNLLEEWMNGAKLAIAKATGGAA